MYEKLHDLQTKASKFDLHLIIVGGAVEIKFFQTLSLLILILRFTHFVLALIKISFLKIIMSSL